MELLFALTAGVLYASGLYLMLRRRLAQLIIGLGLLTNGTNILIFTSGGLTRTNAPVLAADALETTEPFADPVPQALILTAIVIGFGTTAFLLVVAIKAFQATQTDHVQELAERPDPVVPPGEYADPEQPSVSPEEGSPGDLSDGDGEAEDNGAADRPDPADIDWSAE